MKHSSMRQPWKPSPAIKASAVLHLGALSGVAAGLGWPWAVGGILANHAVLTIAGLWPRSTLLGSNMRKLSAPACDAQHIAITIDDGPDPQITPQVLDILDAAGAQATFFCIGKAVEAHPQLAREIIRRGHHIENHSYAHRHYFSVMGLDQLRKEISRAQSVISQTTGHTPVYFRAPAGLRSPLLDPVLQSLNLQLVSWTRRGFDTVATDSGKVLQRLEKGLATGDILLLHDGNAGMTASGRALVLEVLPKLLDTLRARGFRAVSLRIAADPLNSLKGVAE
ncbi:MAG TPA: polysaccharide deacetylase family protein [Polaromonas sp.]|uniref:polysaccharide deacetylase family protein n=2 Tax=Polaromonas sp. TaxID=1869339 RepID=UPI002C5EFB21|nr:polysaccharide deacetylase family protein [Polaromonas sp.]HQS32148.1 polysaccharide deacetylase family protein [Polaromonas sp.]